MNRVGVTWRRPDLPRIAVGFVCAGLVGIAALGQEPVSALEEPQVWEPYKEAWDSTKHEIDLPAIESWLNDLESPDQDVRSQSLKRFQEETGITDYVTEPPKQGTEEEKQLKVWQKYVWYLKAILEKSIPRLLRGPGADLLTEDRRREAVAYIGKECPHPAFVPLLREIVQNPEENEDIRYWAVSSLSYIPHDGMVEFLIDCLDQESRQVRGRTLEQLEKLTSAPPELLPRDLKDLKPRWKAWWAENKHTFKYNRLAALWEH